MRLVGAYAPTPSAADLLEALLLAQARLHAFGVTGWQDAIVGDYGDGTDPAVAYRAAVDAGALTARVVGALWWDRTRGLEQIPDLVARREALSLGRFVATSVKIMQDGVAENFTAAMTRALLRRLRPPHRQLRHLLRAARAAGRRRPPRSTRTASRCTSTPSATAPCARPGRRRGTPSPATAAATRATTSPTSRWCTPTTCRASASSASSPTCRRCGRPTSRRWTS